MTRIHLAPPYTIPPLNPGRGGEQAGMTGPYKEVNMYNLAITFEIIIELLFHNRIHYVTFSQY